MGIEEDDSSETETGLGRLLGGVALGATGWASAIIGPPLLASGGLIGAAGVRDAGGAARSTAGWIAVGGSAVQIGSLAARISSEDGIAGGGLFWLGVAGWGTAMTADTVQHIQNRSGWESVGTARAPARVHLALVPTGKGGALIGTF